MSKSPVREKAERIVDGWMKKLPEHPANFIKHGKFPGLQHYRFGSGPDEYWPTPTGDSKFPEISYHEAAVLLVEEILKNMGEPPARFGPSSDIRRF